MALHLVEIRTILVEVGGMVAERVHEFKLEVWRYRLLYHNAMRRVAQA